MSQIQSQPATSIYVFKPTTDGAGGDRSIKLKIRGDQVDVVSDQHNEPTSVDNDLDSTTIPQQGYRWSRLISEILTADYLDRLTVTLRDHSSLPDLITPQLFQHLLKIYKHKVQTAIQIEGLDAIDASLPHFNLVKGGQKKIKSLDIIIDDKSSQSYLRNSLSEFFTHTGFKDEFVKAIGTHFITWALEEIETSIGKTVFKALTDSELEQTVRDYLLDAEHASVLQEKISFLGQVYCRDITQAIIDSLNLPNCSIQDLENLLGLKHKPPTSEEIHLEMQPIAAIPTSIPIASSIRAQLRPDLWAQNENQLAVFQYRSKNNPSNYIEHYITSPGDIAMLPWEAAEQIINKFGFDTVKLQLIFAARTMDQVDPWKSPFRLKSSDIIQLLGWDRNHSSSMPEKRNAVASAAYALSCMLVKSVWIEGRGKRKVDASTPIGRMWDVLIDPHGQIDWVTGKIENPDEVYITISPGLWTKHFLNRAGSKAKEALHQFGYLARDILQIDPYHNEMALRLAIQLTLDSRVRARNQNPYEYRVVGLLEDVLPRTEIDRALDDKYKARDLKNRWNRALKLLMSLGWEIEFDPDTYPEWLQPGSKAPKPADWRKVKIIERLLRGKLRIKPPQPIPSLLARLKEPKNPKQIEAPPVVEELTGDQMREGREKRGWSRKELAGFLDVSADYIGKLERGDRLITPTLEKKLRRLLSL